MFDEINERPRERLLMEGVEHVSDAELISVVLGHGTRQQSVGQVAEEVLRAIGGLRCLARASPHELIQVSGVGAAQAARLVAAVNLGRRAVLRSQERTTTMRSAEAVWRRLHPRLMGLTQEVFIVIALNARGCAIEEHEVARGTLSRVDVHPRDVFRPLIRLSAAAGVVAHNHPSGELDPSAEDIALTVRLREVGVLLGIPIVDHVVITDDAYRSINEYLGPDLEVELPD